MPETDPITEEDVANAVVRISLALEQLGELLQAANELNRKLVDLHAVLAEPLVDLERKLREGEERTP